MDRKRGAIVGKDIDSASSEFDSDEEAQLFKSVFARIKKKYHLSATEILNLTKDEAVIPCNIFTIKLSPLETAVKYLQENLNYNYTKIAKVLGRDRKTIWQACKNAAKKQPKKFIVKESEYSIPVSSLRSNLSVLEASVSYLKEEFKLSYHDIGTILERNERTIWTVYNRAKKKR